MVLVGLGLGLVTAPATESIVQVLPPARAGVGSAVKDATRELGGTLGVAIVGSLSSSLYGARLATLLDGLVDPALVDAALDSVGFTDALAARVPWRHGFDESRLSRTDSPVAASSSDACASLAQRSRVPLDLPRIRAAGVP